MKHSSISTRTHGQRAAQTTWHARITRHSTVVRPAHLTHGVALAVLAVASVGAPVQALVREGSAALQSKAVQRVAISPDGTFVDESPAEGMPLDSTATAAADAGTPGLDRDSLTSARSTERAPITVDPEAVWTAPGLTSLEGASAISSGANQGRNEGLDSARAMLESSLGKVGDESLRTAVSEGIAVLEQANGQAGIEAATSALRDAVTALDRAVRAAQWINPLASGDFVSGYGQRGYVAGSSAFHNGIDLAAPFGTPIKAAATGTVTYVGLGAERGLTGWVIIVDHGNGLETAYNHMSRSGVLVSVGQTVYAGDVIAKVGSTGRSTGPHLHLSVWQNGSHVNPRTFFASRGIYF